jgi:hypothetical protein
VSSTQRLYQTSFEDRQLIYYKLTLKSQHLYICFYCVLGVELTILPWRV